MKAQYSALARGMLLLAGVAASSYAQASTWYVSNASGLPTTDCTLAGQPPNPPFQTIQPAIDCAKAGDTVSIEGTATAYLLSAPLHVYKPLTFAPTGTVRPVIDGNDAVRVMTIDAGNAQGGVDIQGNDLWIEGGLADQGGGIYVAKGSKATLNQVRIRVNEAKYGGGIFNAGRLTLIDSVVEANTAVGDSTPDRCRTIDPNNGWVSQGGGIYNTGSLSLTRVSLTGNIATTLLNPFNLSGCADGGGIFNADTGDVTLITSHVDGNETHAGALGTTFLSCPAQGGCGSAGGGGIKNDGLATLDNSSSVDGNKARCTFLACAVGGGISNVGALVVKNNSEVNGNIADPSGWGGGVYSSGGATVDITKGAVTIAGNTAGNGAGIFNYGYGVVAGGPTSCQQAKDCGAVSFHSNTTTTFSDNTADQCGPVPGSGFPVVAGDWTGSGTVILMTTGGTTIQGGANLCPHS